MNIVNKIKASQCLMQKHVLYSEKRFAKCWIVNGDIVFTQMAAARAADMFRIVYGIKCIPEELTINEAYQTMLSRNMTDEEKADVDWSWDQCGETFDGHLYPYS